MRFVHLHTHSHYSLLEAVPKIPALIDRVRELGMDAVALTDHGALYGVIEFYKKAKKDGIKPIIGMEVNIAPESHTLRRAGIDDRLFHLTLLAETTEGYRNLMKLSSISFVDGFYYKPRVDKELLRQYHEGIIALSGCLRGEIPKAVVEHDLEKAEKLIYEYQEIFGKKNFFLELVYHPDMPIQTAANAELISLSAKTGAPVVATSDSHFLKPEDLEIHRILIAIQLGRRIDELRREELDMSLRSPEEMIKAFEDVPEAILNTGRIADRCNVEIELGKFYFPKYEVPDNKTADDYLREQAYLGLKARETELTEEMQKRLNYELEIIKNKGYSAYFLIVSDFIRWARENKVVTTTRGSAAGSLVSYSVGITTVDPLRFKLPFERFLNPYRPSAPDIDMDFADSRRDEVIEYATQKYGKDKVAQICTFGGMLARGSVRDVGRALGYPYEFCDRISKMIPMGSQGFPMTLERAIEESDELRQAYKTNKETKRLIDLAKSIEGNARHVSVHAAGVVVSPSALTDFTPVQKERGGERIITQYEMHAVEDIGLVKMDFLGIRNLSILEGAVRLVEKIKGISVDIEKIPFDDPKSFELLAKGQTVGLFQLGGTGMTRYLMELKPTTIHDIMAMVALFRPGPMESIPEYIRRKKNPSLIKCPDPRIKEITSQSFGVITYQDDVLYIAIEVAGYGWEEADKLRKAMGKKIPEEMAKQKDKFITGCQEFGKLPEKTAREIWKLIEPFAAYGFNKSHASSYGIVAYQTAYMKANYTAEFMTAVLTAESGDIETVAEMVVECRKLGIAVLPPDVNESRTKFTYIDDKTIRFGLLAIKNLGEDVADSIIEERDKNGKFKDLADFMKRGGVKSFNKKGLEAMIRSGALEGFGERKKLLENIEVMLAFRRDAQHEADSGQVSLFGSSKIAEIHLHDVPPAPQIEKLSWEKELLGLYVSAHPFEDFSKALGNSVVKVSEINESQRGKKIRIAGMITAIREITTKAGQLMMFARLEDMTGAVEVVVFPRILMDTKSYWKKETCVIVTGELSARDSSPKIICGQVWGLNPQNLDKTVQALGGVAYSR